MISRNKDPDGWTLKEVVVGAAIAILYALVSIIIVTQMRIDRKLTKRYKEINLDQPPFYQKRIKHSMAVM